ncbi:uncharacterized protein A4U43_C07F19600 [Asparagus officinalis]|uniref:Uncharacterized protein n=1 Tax=Asparagus officinalis TaxID=4686 RepID=A0A5P1EDC9_ASPOF|nr:uncharacterized protein A4U43_C07F19600 [Asparagus officinalis]
MENYAYSSYPESGDSSPRSREIECDPAVAVAVAAAAWDEHRLCLIHVSSSCAGYGGRHSSLALTDNAASPTRRRHQILAVEATAVRAVQDRASFADPAAGGDAVYAEDGRGLPLWSGAAERLKDRRRRRPGIEMAPPRSEVKAVVPSPAESQMQLKELQRLQNC